MRRLGHASVKESCLGEAGLLLDDGEVGSLCDEHPTRRSSTVSVVGIKPTVDLQPALPNGATDIARMALRHEAKSLPHRRWAKKASTRSRTVIVSSLLFGFFINKNAGGFPSAAFRL